MNEEKPVSWVVVRRGMDDPTNFYIYPAFQRGFASEGEAITAAATEARRCPGAEVFVAKLVKSCSVEPMAVTWRVL